VACTSRFYSRYADARSALGLDVASPRIGYRVMTPAFGLKVKLHGLAFVSADRDLLACRTQLFMPCP
jgi:hypothetical protein